MCARMEGRIRVPAEQRKRMQQIFVNGRMIEHTRRIVPKEGLPVEKRSMHPLMTPVTWVKPNRWIFSNGRKRPGTRNARDAMQNTLALFFRC